MLVWTARDIIQKQAIDQTWPPAPAEG